MTKRVLRPRTLLGPMPAVLVSSGYCEGPRNIITVTWVGCVNSDPPMVAVGIRPERESYRLVRENREFVINLVSEEEVSWLDYCGKVSGRSVDKFKALGLTTAPGAVVKAPLVAECPVNLECQVRHEIGLPTHVAFIAEVVTVWADDAVASPDDSISPALLCPISFMEGHYWAVGRDLGRIGGLKR